MARYGQAYKDRVVARLLPPESAELDEVSRAVGLSVTTLLRWRADAVSATSGDRAGAGSPRWTAAARLVAVIATANMDDTARST
jgi:transposase